MNARTFLALSTFALATGCGGISTPDDLAARTVELLNDNDLDSFNTELVATPSQLLEICPKLTSVKIDGKDIADGFSECVKTGRFGKAEVASVTSKLTAVSTDECGGDAPVESGDLEVTLKSGYSFTVHKAIKTNDGWKVIDDLKCK